MASGDVRRTQSANFFKTTRRNEEGINPKAKRPREEATPEVLVETASTLTLVEERTEVNPNLLLTEEQKEKKAHYLAIKLNRLKDKNLRYTSHKEFLTSCIKEGLVPKGLELILEPTIGNHDQQFLDNWYSKLKQFSISLMEDIVTFCETTIKSTDIDIKNTEDSLKTSTNKSQFEAIKTEITKNEVASKNFLKQKKFKKYNNLKYKPKLNSASPQNGTQEKQTQSKSLYSDILRRKKSNTRITRKPSETLLPPKKPTTTVDQLKTLNVNHNKGKGVSRSNSTTAQNKEEAMKTQIKQLQQEVQLLKQSSPKEQTQTNNENIQNQKNGQTASSSSGGQTQNVDIINVITYIEQTMQTLKTFGEQLKIQLDTNLTQ